MKENDKLGPGGSFLPQFEDKGIITSVARSRIDRAGSTMIFSPDCGITISQKPLNVTSYAFSFDKRALMLIRLIILIVIGVGMDSHC